MLYLFLRVREVFDSIKLIDLCIHTGDTWNNVIKLITVFITILSFRMCAWFFLILNQNEHTYAIRLELALVRRRCCNNNTFLANW